MQITQKQILLLAIAEARTRLYLARYACEHVRTQKAIDALADAERLVEHLERLFLGQTLPKD